MNWIVLIALVIYVFGSRPYDNASCKSIDVYKVWRIPICTVCHDAKPQ